MSDKQLAAFKREHEKRKSAKSGFKYYYYYNPNVGVRYFRVKKGKDVMQIIDSVQIKKGRAYTTGVTFIGYISFVGSWGWKLDESRNIVEISEKTFNKVLEKMIKKFTK
jgi:hypothetical protein